MRHPKSGTLFAAAAAAAAADVYRKMPLRSVPLCDYSHRSLSVAAGFGINRKRKTLPPELSALGHVAELTCDPAARGGACHVYLVGTCHGSQRSIDEVRVLIQFLKPQVVFLEMCPRKAYMLENVSEGGEFQVANEEAKKYGGGVILGDMPLEIMLARIRIMACLRELVVALPNIIPIIFKRKKNELGPSNQALDKLERTLPCTYDAIVNDRDRYVSAPLLQAACPYDSVVAVVGRGHLRGIQKYWKQPIDIEQLIHTPTRSRLVLSIRLFILCFCSETPI